MKKILEYIVLLQFILCSGAPFWNIYLSGRQIMILFGASSLLLLLTNLRHSNSASLNKNVRILLSLAAFVLINVLIVNRDIMNNSYISILSYFFHGFCIISSFNYYDFRERLYKVFTIILIASIAVQILRNLGFLNAEFYTNETTKSYGLCLGIFHTEWGNINGWYRLSSIFWEPGQLQIVIFFILGLFTDEISDLTKWKNNIKKFGAYIVALLLTMSTAAYIVAIIFMAVMVMSYNRGNSRSFAVCIGLIATCMFANFVVNSAVIQDKFNGVTSDGTENASAAIRAADNLALVKITIENPIFGAGIETKTMQNYRRAYHSETDSNGWLSASASLGLLFLIFYINRIYKGIQRMKPGFNPLLLFIVLFVSQCNEALYYYPYILMYIFYYKSYNKLYYE